MDRSQIEELIPHRAPFLWVDRVDAIEPGVRCVAVKFVDPAEPFFAGHFPGRAIVPGVILVEAMAQTAGVMLAAAGRREGQPVLAAINRFKFFKPVGPGSHLRIETRTVTDAGSMAYIAGSVYSGDELIATGELSVASA